MFFLSDTPSAIELTFMGSAICGSLFFLLRVMMVLVGGFGTGDLDAGHADGSLDSHGDMPHVQDSHDTEMAFKLVSLNSVAAFFMMFGWVGLAAYVQYKLGPSFSLIIATLFGGLTLVLTAFFFKWLMGLQSRGADFKMKDLIGLEAQVYQRIPAKGQGKIQVTCDGMLREIDARSEHGEEIESFVPVRVIGLMGATGVLVQRVKGN